MEEDFLAALDGVPALIDLVGGADDPRMGWGRRPDGEPMPALALHLVSDPETYLLNGDRVGLVGYLVQADCWARTYDQAKLLARAYRDALAGAAFNADAGPLVACFIENSTDDDEPADGPDAAGSKTFFRTRLDTRVWHQLIA